MGRLTSTRTRRRLLRVIAASVLVIGALATWALAAGPGVEAIALSGGKVYAGGTFQDAGGHADADFLAVWDGSWKPFCNDPKPGSAIGANVTSLQIIDHTLLRRRLVPGRRAHRLRRLPARLRPRLRRARRHRRRPRAPVRGLGLRPDGRQQRDALRGRRVHQPRERRRRRQRRLPARGRRCLAADGRGPGAVRLRGHHLRPRPHRHRDQALAIIDRQLYVAGNFTSAGGDPQAHSVASFSLSLSLSQIIAYPTPTVTPGPSAVPTPTVTPSPTPAPHDVTAPKTLLRRARINQAKRKATFRFASGERGSRFLCKLDKKTFKPCTSPKTYKRLKRGKHVFRVKARDRAGNVDATPIVKRFRIKR